MKPVSFFTILKSEHYKLRFNIAIWLWRFQHANAPPAKLKNIFVKTLKRGTKI